MRCLISKLVKLNFLSYICMTQLRLIVAFWSDIVPLCSSLIVTAAPPYNFCFKFNYTEIFDVE